MGLIMVARNDPQSTDSKVTPTFRTYVVYKTDTGEVLHVHHTVTFSHTQQARETPEAHAIRLGGRRVATGADVLEVDSAEVTQGEPIKVDVARKRLVRS